MSPNDTGATQDQVVVHNEYGMTQGCWRRPTR